MQLKAQIPKGYGYNLRFSVVVQLFLLVLGLFATDFGQLAQWVIFSIAIYWAMAVIVIVRRPSIPTRGDLIAIRYGFVLILIVVIFSTSLRWNLAGM